MLLAYRWPRLLQKLFKLNLALDEITLKELMGKLIHEHMINTGILEYKTPKYTQVFSFLA